MTTPPELKLTQDDKPEYENEEDPKYFVQPRVYFLGHTMINEAELISYLQDTGQTEFVETVNQAGKEGLSPAEVLCSMYAKLCYRSLVVGKNPNISQVRGIKENILSCIKTGHMSVFEHANMSFIISGCSRVLTHELVRHRAGTAFSQTSGRYVRGDDFTIVWDPILNPIQEFCERRIDHDRAWYQAARMLMGLYDNDEERMNFIAASEDPTFLSGEIPPRVTDFNTKKLITSALRRFLPEGRGNEIAVTFNIRSLRHIIQMRTSRYAEREIRYIFAIIFQMVIQKYPLVFSDAKTEMIDGIMEVRGMRMQPYDIEG